MHKVLVVMTRDDLRCFTIHDYLIAIDQLLKEGQNPTKGNTFKRLYRNVFAKELLVMVNDNIADSIIKFICDKENISNGFIGLKKAVINHKIKFADYSTYNYSIHSTGKINCLDKWQMAEADSALCDEAPVRILAVDNPFHATSTTSTTTTAADVARAADQAPADSLAAPTVMREPVSITAEFDRLFGLGELGYYSQSSTEPDAPPSRDLSEMRDQSIADIESDAPPSRDLSEMRDQSIAGVREIQADEIPIRTNLHKILSLTRELCINQQTTKLSVDAVYQSLLKYYLPHLNYDSQALIDKFRKGLEKIDINFGSFQNIRAILQGDQTEDQMRRYLNKEFNILSDGTVEYPPKRYDLRLLGSNSRKRKREDRISSDEPPRQKPKTIS